MRVSEGITKGRYAELSNPEMLQEHEEVIVFTREQFARYYTSLMEQINIVNGIDLHYDRKQEWKLLGLWPKIMERIQILDINMDSILKKEPLQCYLDASLYETVQNPSRHVFVPSKKKVPIQQTLPI
jgi:hypothetical protein